MFIHVVKRVLIYVYKNRYLYKSMCVCMCLYSVCKCLSYTVHTTLKSQDRHFFWYHKGRGGGLSKQIPYQSYLCKYTNPEIWSLKISFEGDRPKKFNPFNSRMLSQSFYLILILDTQKPHIKIKKSKIWRGVFQVVKQNFQEKIRNNKIYT